MSEKYVNSLKWKFEINLFGIKDRRPAEDAPQNRGLKIVDHDSFGHGAEKFKRILVTGQEVLHGLADGKLDIHHATVAQDHDKEAQPSSGVAHVDRAV